VNQSSQAVLASGAKTSPISPSVKVTDANGNAVANVTVTVQVTGGGSVQRTSPKTNGVGVASAGTWTLGSKFGTQTVTMSVSGLPAVLFSVTTVGTYAIDVRYVGTPPSAAIQTAFADAALRMSQVITKQLTPLNAEGDDASDLCDHPGLPTFHETVQNLVIFAEITPIDGAGGILGQSGPCAVRTSTSLPFVGIMQFDSADLETMVANGLVNDVILHEMNHVVGYGTLWDGSPFPTMLLQNVGTANPIFLGSSARTQYVSVGGTSSAGVPVEGGNIDGTSNSHWRETVFGDELMTGFLSGTIRPYSKVSIASLADLGYTVSLDTADPFFLSPGGSLRIGPPPAIQFSGAELLHRPKYKVDEATGKKHRMQ